jgi:hypothetical protein
VLTTVTKASICAVLFLYLISGCDYSPKNVGLLAPSAPPAEKKLDPAAGVPPGCKHECLALSPNCFSFARSVFDSYPGDLDHLYSAAKALAVGENGEIALGGDGAVDLEIKMPVRSFTFHLRPTKQIRFKRESAADLKLSILSEGDVPVLIFDDKDLAKDWFGSLRSIDFINKNPVFQFDELNCLRFE